MIPDQSIALLFAMPYQIRSCREISLGKAFCPSKRVVHNKYENPARLGCGALGFILEGSIPLSVACESKAICSKEKGGGVLHQIRSDGSCLQALC